LGLPPDFDDKELKKAFRREARKWHPDLNKNDLNAEERFKLINEAYEYLRDPNISKNISDENIQEDHENNNFKTGFPDFQDYLDSFIYPNRLMLLVSLLLYLSSLDIHFQEKNQQQFLLLLAQKHHISHLLRV